MILNKKNEVVYEEKIAVLEFEVKDKSNAITRLKNQLDETLREKDYLKAKLEQFETSSKNLNKLINSQLSAKDKTGLGYGDQLNENDSSGSGFFNSVFDSHLSDGDDNQTNDRFKKDNRYHDVYRHTSNKTSASVSQVEASTSQTRNTSIEMPRVESVRPSRVIIEDWVSDDEDIFQSNDLHAADKLSFKRIEFTNARNESEDLDRDTERGFDLSQVSSKAHREGVGLRVADSHTGNHPEGGITPFETIRRFLVVIGRISHSGFKGEAFEPKRRIRHQVAFGEFRVEELANYLHEYMLVLDLKKKRKKKESRGLERQRKWSSTPSQPRRRKYRHVESSDDDLNEEDASKQGKERVTRTDPMGGLVGNFGVTTASTTLSMLVKIAYCCLHDEVIE
ncbi:hypothetical protein Tco_0764878 [Tanacetum coccineum]